MQIRRISSAFRYGNVRDKNKCSPMLPNCLATLWSCFAALLLFVPKSPVSEFPGRASSRSQSLASKNLFSMSSSSPGVSASSSNSVSSVSETILESHSLAVYQDLALQEHHLRQALRRWARALCPGIPSAKR